MKIDPSTQTTMDTNLESALKNALHELFQSQEQEREARQSTDVDDSPPILGAGEDDFSHQSIPENIHDSRASRRDTRRSGSLSKGQQDQLDRMVSDALKSGIADHAIASSPTIQRNSEGATAELVVSISLDLQFFAKWQSDDKLLREAGFLQSIAARSDLTQNIRSRFPKVYAVASDGERHSYLMQKFPSPRYQSLAKRLENERENDAMCRQMISAAYDALFDTYSRTVSGSERPLLPAIESIYIGRIIERLDSHELPDELEDLIAHPLLVQGRNITMNLASCRDMLNEVSNIWPKLVADITPSFITLVIGDPHPGNILLDTSRSYAGMSEGVKFIDPKEWGDGDYLFDIAKFLHYLEVTFLVEDLQPPATSLTLTQSGVELSYDLESPSWISHGRQDVEHRIRSLLADPKLKLKDPFWKMRLELGMASNLLGVASSRYRNQIGTRDSRRIIFAQGVLSLHRFLNAAKSLNH